MAFHFLPLIIARRNTRPPPGAPLGSLAMDFHGSNDASAVGQFESSRFTISSILQT